VNPLNTPLLLTDYLRTVIANDEADCQPGYGLCRMTLRHRRLDYSIAILTQPTTSLAYCAAQFLGGFFLFSIIVCDN